MLLSLAALLEDPDNGLELCELYEEAAHFYVFSPMKQECRPWLPHWHGEGWFGGGSHEPPRSSKAHLARTPSNLEVPGDSPNHGS